MNELKHIHSNQYGRLTCSQKGIEYTFHEYKHTNMITFLVVGDFVMNATLLDNKRLAKQRVEAHQILEAIQKQHRWTNHPAVLAWKHYIDALKYYINCIILEWIKRGGENNLSLFEIPPIIMIPWWVKWDRLHHSHRAMLMRKDPFYYQDKFTVEPEYYNYGYIWPHSVVYQNRFAALSEITYPIPKELIDPVYCSALLKSGQRSGLPCNRLVKDKYALCTVHRKTL